MNDIDFIATSWCYSEIEGLNPLPDHYVVFNYGVPNNIGLVLVDTDKNDPIMGPLLPNSMLWLIMDMRKHLTEKIENEKI